MKKVVGVLLITLLCLSAISVPIGALGAFDTDYSAERRDAEKILGRDIPPKYEDFALSCSADDMLHGFPTATVDGVTYAFSDGKLCCTSRSNEHVTTVIDCCDGDNLNRLGTQLIFSVTENGDACIKSYSICDGEYKTVLSLNEGKIKYLYVVNDTDIFFLYNGTVYTCGIDGTRFEKVSSIPYIESFTPTDSGILYAVEANDLLSVYLDDTFILGNASYYSVIQDYLVASVDSEMYQLPISELRSAMSYAEQNGLKEFDVLNYMSAFDLYGTYDAYDILNFNDSAALHSDIADSASAYGLLDERKEFDAHISAVYSAAGDMIIAQANQLMSYPWTPLEDIRSYINSNGNYIVFEAGDQQTGIPYSRRDNFPVNYRSEQRYITYEEGNVFDSDNLGRGKLSLDRFGVEVLNPNSLFYSVEQELINSSPAPGPLYGCDCSGFVSYSWRINRITTKDFKSLSDCTALSLSVSVLRPGDALVRYIGPNSPNHCILIKSVSNSNIVVWEQTPPQTREMTYGISAFNNKYFNITDPYIPYRLNTVNITLNVNGGQTLSPSTYTVAPKFTLENVTLPTPVRSGYRFLGWYTAASGGTKVDSSYVVNADVTLYAHWINQNAVIDSPAIIISNKESHELSDSKNKYWR
ncbi:MAG: InlB B-repeat-containing protein [Clostridiales bacterium]|nr:InlB B-repeat-containing protein [Clostridiales bacterium]